MHLAKLYVSYSGTFEEWETFAKWFENRGETRLARSIRYGVEKHKRRGWPGYCALRFQGGSIDKLAEACEEIDFPDPLTNAEEVLL